MKPALLTVSELHREIVIGTGAAVLAIQIFELYTSGCLLALKGSGGKSPEALFSGERSRRLP
jgi:hypothetical protein